MRTLHAVCSVICTLGTRYTSTQVVDGSVHTVVAAGTRQKGVLTVVDRLGALFSDKLRCFVAIQLRAFILYY